MSDVLERILRRKQQENARRARFASLYRAAADASAPVDPRHAVDALRRGKGPPKVIAEIKFASPSAGAIRARAHGDVEFVAEAYTRGGASALSVLADRVGFDGSPLYVRRAASASALPVLFKEFVLDELQLDLARAMGARYVLLLVVALDAPTLASLVAAAEARGLVPLVEAASASELEVALATPAPIVGINARDLRTFDLDHSRAARLMEAIPDERVAVYMSGVRDREGFQRAATGRADAMLIGEGLMRASDPHARLSTWLSDFGETT